AEDLRQGAAAEDVPEWLLRGDVASGLRRNSLAHGPRHVHETAAIGAIAAADNECTPDAAVQRHAVIGRDGRVPEQHAPGRAKGDEGRGWQRIFALSRAGR